MHPLIGLGSAWLAGSAIGLERTWNGRVAGFRTHGIVALAAAVVVLIARAPEIAPALFPAHTPMFDPTRLAQGVMTGVGFLGAGVIFKEGVSVQGLTTAASIWATAGIGLVLGLGLYQIGIPTTLAVLISLTAFRWVEGRLPSRVYALAVFRFEAADAPDIAGVRRILAPHARLDEISIQRVEDRNWIEYRGNVEVRDPGGLDRLAQSLRTAQGLREFDLSRISK